MAGIPEHEIENSTLRYLSARIQSVHERITNAQTHDWHITRWLGCIVVNLAMPKGKRLKVTDLLHLPGDAPPPETASPGSNTEAMRQLVQIWNTQQGK